MLNITPNQCKSQANSIDFFMNNSELHDHQNEINLIFNQFKIKPLYGFAYLFYNEQSHNDNRQTLSEFCNSINKSRATYYRIKAKMNIAMNAINKVTKLHDNENRLRRSTMIFSIGSKKIDKKNETDFRDQSQIFPQKIRCSRVNLNINKLSSYKENDTKSSPVSSLELHICNLNNNICNNITYKEQESCQSSQSQKKYVNFPSGKINKLDYYLKKLSIQYSLSDAQIKKIKTWYERILKLPSANQNYRFIELMAMFIFALIR